ncbi:cell division protein FtsX [Evansella vedderi]|uniref:Cell division protein FtsX n=1 Tax=Evansella vedderi TaxID=38282 RepID=A0ABU0A3V8_9BACI|nr:YhcN/YlaJ family sporulation lipoprotein [Evansella vedderi]MDQ0257697.1 cell division protein FtsX [Evansella vedderi]
MKKWGITFCMFFLCGLLFIGCETAEGEQRALSTTEKKPTVSQQLANEIKTEISKMKEVDNVRAISLDKDVYITLTVTGFDRLFLQEIRQNAHKRAKSVEEKGNIHVSTDKKLDQEISSLEKQVKEGKITKEQLSEKLKKIEKDMKG